MLNLKKKKKILVAITRGLKIMNPSISTPERFTVEISARFRQVVQSVFNFL